MSNITSMKILKTHRAQKREIAWSVEFLDRRKASPVLLTITREELQFPERPCLLGIEVACIRRLAPPIKLKPSKSTRAKPVRWTPAHEAARDVARIESADIDKTVSAIPAAHGESLAVWETSDAVRARAFKRAACAHEMTPNQFARWMARLEDSYLDHSSVTRWDEFARELASEFPELGLDADDCAQQVWDMLREPIAPRPTKFGAATIRRAAEMVATVATDEIEFAEWSADADDSAPF